MTHLDRSWRFQPESKDISDDDRSLRWSRGRRYRSVPKKKPNFILKVICRQLLFNLLDRHLCLIAKYRAYDLQFCRHPCNFFCIESWKWCECWRDEGNRNFSLFRASVPIPWQWPSGSDTVRWIPPEVNRRVKWPKWKRRATPTSGWLCTEIKIQSTYR